jgi:tRNA (guanine-N7-)-methyltransferase
MRLRNIPGAKDAILDSPYVIQEPENHKGLWAEAFPSRQPLHIEVGMGKGRFLMDMARLHPDINYVGIEMYDSVLLRALQKREELEDNGESLPNLFFMRVDARNLPEIFNTGEVDKIYLNFSDPWPKARHAKRRLTSRQFLSRYDKILGKDGTVEFKTDNRELFEFSLEEVEAANWTLLAHTFDLHNNAEMMQGNVMTEYEEKFSSMGNPICKLIINR